MPRPEPSRFYVKITKKPLKEMWYRTRVGETFLVNRIIHPYNSIPVFKVVDLGNVNQLFIYCDDAEILPFPKPVKTDTPNDPLVNKVKGIRNRHKCNYDPSKKFVPIKTTKINFKGYGDIN